MLKWIARSLYGRSVLTLCLISFPAHASSKKPTGPPTPGSKAALMEALSSAQKVYLRYGADESTATAYTADYTTFYEDMQTWGRYQLLPSTTGADLVLVYAAFCRDTCSIAIYDGETMAWIGTINQYLGGSSLHVSNKARKNGGAKFIKTLEKYIGSSQSTSPHNPQTISTAPPVPPLPVWAQTLGSNGSAPFVVEKGAAAYPEQGTPAFQNAFVVWVKTVNNVLVVDDDATFSQNNPFGRKDALTLLEGDLNAWGRYKLVSSLANADFVLEVTAIGYADERGFVTASLTMNLQDPKTLRTVAVRSVPLRVSAPKKNKPDPFPIGIQGFVDVLRSIVGDPWPSPVVGTPQP